MPTFLMTDAADVKYCFTALSCDTSTYMCGETALLAELLSEFFEIAITKEQVSQACTHCGLTADTLIRENQFADFLHYLTDLMEPTTAALPPTASTTMNAEHETANAFWPATPLQFASGPPPFATHHRPLPTCHLADTSPPAQPLASALPPPLADTPPPLASGLPPPLADMPPPAPALWQPSALLMEHIPPHQQAVADELLGKLRPSDSFAFQTELENKLHERIAAYPPSMQQKIDEQAVAELMGPIFCECLEAVLQQRSHDTSPAATTSSSPPIISNVAAAAPALIASSSGTQSPPHAENETSKQAAPEHVPSAWQPPYDCSDLAPEQIGIIQEAVLQFTDGDADILKARVAMHFEEYWRTLLYTAPNMKHDTYTQWASTDYWLHALPVIQELLSTKQPQPFDFVPFYDLDAVSQELRPAVDAAIPHIDSEDKFQRFVAHIETTWNDRLAHMKHVPEKYHGTMRREFDLQEYFPLLVDFAGTAHLALRTADVLHAALSKASSAAPPAALPHTTVVRPAATPPDLRQFLAPTSPPSPLQGATRPAANHSSPPAPAVSPIAPSTPSLHLSSAADLQNESHSPLGAALAKRQRLATNVAATLLAPVGAPTPQSIADLHLRPQNVMSNRVVDARLVHRDAAVRQVTTTSGIRDCYGLTLSDNSSLIKFSAWGSQATSVFNYLGPQMLTDEASLLLRLTYFNVSPVRETSCPRLCALHSVETTTVEKLHAVPPASLYLQPSVVLSMETLLSTYEIVANASLPSLVNLHGIVRNVRTMQHSQKGKPQKIIELVDTTNSLLEVRACGDIALHEDLLPLAHLALFFVQGMAANPGYRACMWLYDSGFVAKLGQVKVEPPVYKEIKLPLTKGHGPGQF